MKNFKIFAFVAMMSVSQMNAVNIPAALESCQKTAGEFGKNLLDDTKTQGVTLTSVAGSVVLYKYYYYQAALVCLDGHYNSKIMHRSDLIYMTYSDFVNKLASIHSYAETLDFMDEYCTTCYSYSDSKIYSTS